MRAGAKRHEESLRTGLALRFVPGFLGERHARPQEPFAAPGQCCLWSSVAGPVNVTPRHYQVWAPARHGSPPTRRDVAVDGIALPRSNRPGAPVAGFHDGLSASRRRAPASSGSSTACELQPFRAARALLGRRLTSGGTSGPARGTPHANNVSTAML
jgi:hypothetical protein